MNTRLIDGTVASALAVFSTGLAMAAVVDSAQDNVDIAVSDNYRTVLNAGVTFRAEPAAGKEGSADISWIIVGGSNPGSTDGIGSMPANGVTVPVEVPAKTSLKIGRLDGGRALQGSPHKLIKTGAGTLSLDEARNFGGAVHLNAGTLLMDKRAVPTALPSGAIVHFDFSLEQTISKDANGRVSSVANLGSASCTLAQATAARQPTFVRDLPSKGLNGLDFGSRDTTDGRYLSFTPAQSLATVLVVVDSRVCTPTHILNGSFRCKTDQTACNYNWTSDAYARFKDSVAAAWVNGLPIKIAKEFYETPGFNVVALQAPVNSVSVLGGLSQYTYGGLRIFEVVGYDRSLTDREVRDASALLAKKWLKRVTPGYADETGVADLQHVEAAGGTTLDVTVGTTGKIGALTLSGPVAKTGAGALEVQTGNALGSYMTVRGGVVGAAGASDVTSNCEIAMLPALHLDASRPDLVKTFNSPTGGATNFIWCWQDESGRVSVQKRPANGSWGIDYSYPWYNTDADALCNGLPVVDFGPRAPGWSNSVGASIPLSRSLQNVRAVYFVMGSQAGGGNVLGNGTPDLDSFLHGRNYDFFRGEESGGTATRPLFMSSCPAVTGGEIFINGIRKDHVTDYVPNGGYELIELHTTAGCKFSNIGNGHELYLHGGFRLGEIIVFERPLTDRERVATRNFLMKKWFAKKDSELAPLPPKPAVGTLAVRAIAADMATAIGGDVEAVVLSGTGMVETAGHTLTTRDISDFAGEMKVDGGLVLNGKLPPVTPELVSEGRILHLDTFEGVTTETNDDGVVSVKAWASKLNDGLVALPGPAYRDVTTTNFPSYLPYGLDMKPVIMMAGSGQQHFLFCRSGVTTRLSNIQSVFWVIGSQEGGGFLLGGGSTGGGTASTGEPYVSGYTWHRGGNSAGSQASDALLSGNPPNSVRNGAWRINGSSVPASSTGLSGGYDIVSFVMQENGTDVIDADGLAFDGRYLGNLADQYGRVGRQRISELIVYDRRLSEEEVSKVESYLASKWGFAQKSITNNASVEVSKDATVVCSNPQYVGKLFGAGLVTGDVTVKNFVAGISVGALTVNGKLTIAENPVVEIRNPGSDGEIVIAKATSYEGVENLRNATIVGGADCSFKIRIVNGRLVAVRRGGLLLVVR